MFKKTCTLKIEKIKLYKCYKSEFTFIKLIMNQFVQKIYFFLQIIISSKCSVSSLKIFVRNLRKIISCFSFRLVSISQPIIGNKDRFFQQIFLSLLFSFYVIFRFSLPQPNGRLNVSHYSGASRNLTKAMRPHSFMGAHVFTRLFHLLLEEQIDRRFCIWPPHMVTRTKKRVLAENDQTVIVNMRQKIFQIVTYTSMLSRNLLFFQCFVEKKVVWKWLACMKILRENI